MFQICNVLNNRGICGPVLQFAELAVTLASALANELTVDYLEVVAIVTRLASPPAWRVTIHPIQEKNETPQIIAKYIPYICLYDICFKMQCQSPVTVANLVIDSLLHFTKIYTLKTESVFKIVT